MKKSTIALIAATIVLGSLVALPRVTQAYQGDPNVQGPNYSEDRHEAMTAAFANNDYAAWKELMQSKGRITDVINETNFAQFAKAHQLMLAGDTDGAAQIRAELGLGLRNGAGQGECQRQNQGNGRGRNTR